MEQIWFETHHQKPQTSMYKPFDELQRGVLLPDELEESLDVGVHNGCLHSVSNRRLFVLLLYQVVHRDRVIEAPCCCRQHGLATAD